jgi:co-chaperonin GroES (HSP10)
MKGIKLQPIEYRVVVKLDGTEEVFESSIPGLVKPETTKREDKRMQTKGVLVAVSDCSFSDWDGENKPKVGDRVECAQYPGQEYFEDDVGYRIMNDRDVIGILKE